MLRILIFILIYMVSTNCASQQDNSIVIVNIGDLRRLEIAKLISQINASKPKVLAVNVRFDTNKDHNTDEILVNSLWSCNQLVVGGVLENENGNYLGKDESYKFSYGSLPEFVPFKAKIGFTNLIFENDDLNTVKRFSVKERVQGNLRNNFAVQISVVYDSIKTAKFINSNPKIVNVKYTKDKPYRIIEASAVLGNKNIDFSNKIVLIGFTGPGDEEKFFSPMNKRKQPFEPDIYAVEYYAYIISQILNL